MKVLVSDTSVLIDLERGTLLESVFGLPARFAVPDLLYERELKDHGGPAFLDLGLSVLELDGAGVQRAIANHTRFKRLSLPDCIALELAQRSQHMLLTGDGALRTLAESEGVECHGVLWIFDQLIEAKTVPRIVLAAKIKLIVEHVRCRLPREEVLARLQRLRG